MIIKIDKVYDCVTGETTITERDETPQEREERLEIEAELAKKQAEAAAKAAQRQALLDKLGITEDEARLLLGGN